MEVIADHQKTIAKKKNPKFFVSQGLYKIVRCPNYLGEIIIWIGFFLSAIQTYKNILQFVIAFSGLVTVIFIMFGGARRLEIRQDKNYGDMKEYQIYKSNVPIMIPFLPIYSVKKYSWLVG
jgi:steroid 5-alpha reductase family enzyme